MTNSNQSRIGRLGLTDDTMPARLSRHRLAFDATMKSSLARLGLPLRTGNKDAGALDDGAEEALAALQSFLTEKFSDPEDVQNFNELLQNFLDAIGDDDDADRMAGDSAAVRTARAQRAQIAADRRGAADASFFERFPDAKGIKA